MIRCKGQRAVPRRCTGGCLVPVNKKPILACAIFSEKEIVIEPLPDCKVLKDLIMKERVND
jgi:succinate dehydrogenase/fumarate reductase-like Fe-S protein